MTHKSFTAKDAEDAKGNNSLTAKAAKDAKRTTIRTKPQGREDNAKSGIQGAPLVASELLSSSPIPCSVRVAADALLDGSQGPHWQYVVREFGWARPG